MLQNAGVTFECLPAAIDEADEKARHRQAEGLTVALARAKALAVSKTRKSDWVIGSDSTVTVAGRLFDKPGCREEAASHLKFFSGKAMQLTSAVALARGDAIDWDFVDSSTLAVRPLSDAFIASYLDAEWPDVGHCVGVFRMEGRGVQLFDTIDGSYFTVLGMPLLPLLGALRQRGMVPE